jgi:hypothetical protein
LSDRSDKLKLDPLNRPIVGKEARDLAVEMKADEQAARVRDYGVEDAATYEQRVKVGAGTPAAAWRPEFERMMEVIANPSSEFRKRLENAADRGSNRAEGKDGPER